MGQRVQKGQILMRLDPVDLKLSFAAQQANVEAARAKYTQVVQLAEALPKEAWKPLERLTRYEIATEPRRKPQRIKEAIVRFKGYLNKKLVGESVAEFDYQPLKCGRSYRLVVVRKNISVQKGTGAL